MKDDLRHVWVSCGNGGECDVCKCAHDDRAPATCPGPASHAMSGRVDDLIARLRSAASVFDNCYRDEWPSAEDELNEAADEIERLRARVAELEATVNEWAGV